MMQNKMSRLFVLASMGLVASLLTACTTVRRTEPARTATEELIISSAVDRMVTALQVNIPAGTKVFVDNTYFDGTDAKYAEGAIRDRLLRAGARLMGDKKDADMVIEARAGAESIDQHSFLIGIPETPIPLPLSGTLTIPEIALFKRAQMQGVSKAAITGYDAKTGELRLSSGNAYGYSHDTDWTVLILISWSNMI